MLLSLVRAPALPPRHAYFGSQSHTPYDRCLRFGPRVAATPAKLAPVPFAQLWTDQACTGKLIPTSPIAPGTGLLPEVERDRRSGLGRPIQFRSAGRFSASCDTPKPALCPGRASASTTSSSRVPSLHTLRRRSSRLCSGASQVVWTRPTPPAFLTGYAHSSFPAWPGDFAAADGKRSPRFRRVPFLRDVASDPGRATGPRIAAPHMLPSAPLTASAPAT